MDWIHRTAKAKKVKYKGEVGSVWKVRYLHTYMGKDHICLELGNWCFKNFRENPRALIAYIKMKL